MTTVIFVHGTSVREPEFSETFELIKSELHKELPDLNVVPCSWGNSLGAKLNAEGASIPLYDSTQNSDEENLIDEEIIRWQQLYQDPLYELRLLSIRTPEEKKFRAGQENLEDELKRKVKKFIPSGKLKPKLRNAGIDELLDQARNNIIRSTPYRDALKTITNTVTEYRNAIARAIIAEVMAICQKEEKSLPIMTDADLRDDIVDLFSSEIMYSEKAIGDWVKEKASKLLATGGTYYLKRNRGSATDASYPIVGDILLYQGRGEEIRQFVKTYIDGADSSVVLIAHSLGGIACVDLLVSEPLDKVKLLVTVGSQAPFFYEIDALQSLKYGKKLPTHFPSWLNIYDLKDILSYIGGNLFPNKVQDILVDNKQPFPRSHGAYWTNSATWKAIVRRIKDL